MEQLRKALLQAKREREGIDGENAQSVASRTEACADTSATAINLSDNRGDSRQSAPREVDITYIETKVVELNPDVLESNRVLSGKEPAEVMQAYKMLRTQVLQKLKFNQWNSLAIVSPREGNGKTLTAINLAISLAQEVKHSVLLVDLDLKDPSVADYMGITLELGITDYLLRDEPIRNILLNPGLERLVVLGGHENLSHSSEALGSPKLINLVEELKQRYPNRIVIFDLPPLLLSDDAVAFSPYVDAMLMVVEEGQTTSDDLERCAEMLGDKPLLGSVLNKGG